MKIRESNWNKKILIQKNLALLDQTKFVSGKFFYIKAPECSWVHILNSDVKEEKWHVKFYYMLFINKDNLDKTKWWDYFKTFVNMDENYASSIFYSYYLKLHFLIRLLEIFSNLLCSSKIILYEYIKYYFLHITLEYLYRPLW